MPEPLSIDRFYGLITTGFISGCVAVVGDYDELYNNLLKIAPAYFGKIEMLNLPSDYLFSSLNQEINYDLLFVKGLNNLQANDDQVYTLRTFLDIQKANGLAALLFLNREAYQKHFRSYSAPFYMFCSSVAVDQLSP